jgi:hypothetical protein
LGALFSPKILITFNLAFKHATCHDAIFTLSNSSLLSYIIDHEDDQKVTKYFAQTSRAFEIGFCLTGILKI